MLPSSTALANTVVSFPPKDSVGPGPLVFDLVRGPLLPPRGTKERDRILRIFDQNDFASNWQGATSGILKKVAQTRIQFNGPPSKVQYFQDMAGTAHFGHGWEYLTKLIGRDFLTQSYGGIFEIAGPGDPTQPLIEAPTGINHLDSGRCYVTGNPIYPIIYYSLWDGKLHKMHASRVYMVVDDPNPDERYFGIGRCALERAIAISQREIRMGQYIDSLLDDRPQPGILQLTGVSEQNWTQKVAQYMMQQQNDDRPVFGRTIVLTSLDPNAKVEAEVTPFAQTPEKFDWIKYMDADLSNYALAIGVDRQEIAELTGKALGSGAQSETLSSKSSGKFYGDFYAQMSRFWNWAILPDDCEATVVEDDTQEKSAQAQIDTQYSSIASSLSSIGVPIEVTMKLLAQVSPTFETAFTDERGNIVLPKQEFQPQITEQAGVDNTTPMPDTASTPTQRLALPETVSAKAYGSTSADFQTRFVDIVTRAVQGRIRRNQAENLMLGLLNSSGIKAFQDGLIEGGVSGDLDDEDMMRVQDWLSDTIDYLDPFLSSAFDGSLPEAQVSSRSLMWTNKSLGQMHAAGRLSADRNAMYLFTGKDGKENCPTCKRLKGQVHRFKDWERKNLIPGLNTDTFECGGWRCEHRLIKTAGRAVGNF